MTLLRALVKYLLYIVVVEGLDNFRVGGSATQYDEGTEVDPGEYTECATVSGHLVTTGSTLYVACGTPLTTQYVIVQSLDHAAERLCLAEVAVLVAG